MQGVGNKTLGVESDSDRGVAVTAQTTRETAEGQWRRGQWEGGETPGEEVEGGRPRELRVLESPVWWEPRGESLRELIGNLTWRWGTDQKPVIPFRGMRSLWWVIVGQKVENSGKAWG